MRELIDAFTDEELTECLDVTRQAHAVMPMALHGVMERLHGLRQQAKEDDAKLPKILLGMPSYNRRIDFGSSEAFWLTHSRPGCGFKVKQAWARGGCTHNTLLTMGLNARKHGFKKLAILHDDVEPAHWWLESLNQFQQGTGAAVVCATIALKDSNGFTSVGALDPTNDDRLVVRRMSLTEANAVTKPLIRATDIDPKLPALAISIGCCLIDLSFPGLEGMDLSGRAGICQAVDDAGNEAFVSRFESEDWLFSRELHRRGGFAVAVAPKVLPVVHHGDWPYGNDAWGTQGTDQRYLDTLHELEQEHAA